MQKNTRAISGFVKICIKYFMQKGGDHENRSNVFKAFNSHPKLNLCVLTLYMRELIFIVNFLLLYV